MGRERKGRGVGRGIGWGREERKGGKGKEGRERRRGEGRGGEYRHFFLYTLSTERQGMSARTKMS